MRAENALKKLRKWADHSEWNFKNKLLLAEAEFFNTQKDYDTAATYYEASVEASKKAKFIHDEAVASELAATFFLERGLCQKSHSYFKHSIDCYQKWGAFAVARRVKDVVQATFGSDFAQPDFTQDVLGDELCSELIEPKPFDNDSDAFAHS